MTRPPVSLIVPFKGSKDALADLVGRLAILDRTHEDELIVVWNSAAPPPDLASMRGPALRILAASREASSYYARNVGAAHAQTDWLLFIDGDCSPDAALLDEYFPGAHNHDTRRLVAGRIMASGETTVIERYARSRRHLSQEDAIAEKPLGFAQTANLLVAKSLWTELDGFAEGVVSGGDADFCWRAQLRGAALDYAPHALVAHQHRETVRELWNQWMKYGRGRRWLASRHPDRTGHFPPAPGLARSVVAACATLPRRDTERSLFALLDTVCLFAFCVGWFRSNTARLLHTDGKR